MPGPIGYTVRFIRSQLEKRRQTQQQGDDSPKPGNGGSVATPTERSFVDKAAADGGQQWGGPIDEEGHGKAGAPEITGMPRDPANARSKRLSYYAIIVAGFALAVDFTMSLMSIQPLFYLMEGPQSLYGLTFGCYDLTAMLFAPLFGLWTDRTRRFKPQIVFGSVVNAAGNLLYAFTVLAGEWWIMLLSRLVAGVGAATLGIGSSYITQTTTSEQRQVKLGRYRITQNVARMVGPFVGYLFLGLPNVTSDSSAGLKLFNWYTVPGWCAFVLVALVVVGFAWAFQEPTDENEHLVKPEARDASQGPPSRERVRKFWWFAVPWLFLTFLIVFAATGFTANLFGLAAGQYHLVHSQGDNWRTYIGIGIGAMVAGILFRRMIRWAPTWWEERKLVLLSNWVQLLYWLLVIPYQGQTWVPPEGLYYAATGLAGFTVVINQASIETFFSKKLTQYADVVGDNIGKWMGAYFMCASAGRFAGPLVIGGVTKIATPDGQTGYCTQWENGPDGAPDCVGPYDQQCVITGDRYWVGGCVLLHAIPMYAAVAAMQLCVNVACAYMLRRNWSWGSGSSGGAKDLAAGAASDAKGAPAGGSDDTKGVPDSAEEAKGLK